MKTEARPIKPTNEICPGCENHLDPSDSLVTYFGDLWHEKCAKEDKIFHDNWDAKDKYRHEYDQEAR